MSSTATTEAEVVRVLGSGDEHAMRALHARLVAEKLDIQTQITNSKAEEAQVRKDLLATGVDPHSASIQATATVNQTWRRRAAHAVLVKDQHIKQINTVLGQLAQVAQVARQKSSRPRKVAERQAIVFPLDKVDVWKMAAMVQTWLDDGWTPLSTMQLHPDGAIVVFRKDYEVAPPQPEGGEPQKEGVQNPP